MAFHTNGAEGGEMLIERMSIEEPSWGAVVDVPNVTMRVRRAQIIDPLAYGVRMTNGGLRGRRQQTIIVADTEDIP